MGMFDYVNYPPQPCWRCGRPVGGPTQWQSKSRADCYINTLEPSMVSEFYSACDSCGAWNQYRVEQSHITHLIIFDEKESKLGEFAD